MDAFDDLRREREASLPVCKTQRNIADFKNKSRASTSRRKIRCHLRTSEKSQLGIARGIDEHRSAESAFMPSNFDGYDLPVNHRDLFNVRIEGKREVRFPRAQVRAEVGKIRRLPQKNILAASTHGAASPTALDQALRKLHRKTTVRRPRNHIGACAVKPAHAVHKQIPRVSTQNRAPRDEESSVSRPRERDCGGDTCRSRADDDRIEMLIARQWGEGVFQSRCEVVLVQGENLGQTCERWQSIGSLLRKFRHLSQCTAPQACSWPTLRD